MPTLPTELAVHRPAHFALALHLRVDQKVITCVIRFFSVALLLYSTVLTLVVLLTSGSLWVISLVATGPMFISGLLLFLAAIPLSRLITWGIRDY